MPQQIPVTPVPLLLETKAQQFDGAFEKLGLAQRFPALPGGTDANRVPQALTGLANTESVVGAQHTFVQALKWFLTW